MNESGLDERLSREALEQHEQLRFFVGRLEESLAALDPASGDVTPLRELVAQIESFKDRLLEHHQHEESGLFRAIVEFLPEAEGDVLALSEEHRRMIETLEMARIHAENDDASGLQAFREDLESFLETIRDHERAEDALLKRALSKEK